MPAVPAMHEEMAQRTEQENKVRQHSQDVSAMLCPKKERRGYQEHRDSSPIQEMAGLFGIVG
jgi:hypothetical protein